MAKKTDETQLMECKCKKGHIQNILVFHPWFGKTRGYCFKCNDFKDFTVIKTETLTALTGTGK